MITKEERESIICEALERMLRAVPETIGNMMKSQAIYADLNKKFYADNPDLLEHRDIVQQVIFKLEGQNTLASYDEIIKKALPEIRDQVRIKSTLSNDPVKRKDLNFKISMPDNGEI